MDIIYPSVENIIDANKKAIELLRATKSEKHELLASKEALQAIINKAVEIKGNIKKKAATLMSEINRRHLFGSANKRTSFIVACDFMLANSGILPLKKKEDVKFLIEVREGKRSIEEIERWLDA